MIPSVWRGAFRLLAQLIASGLMITGAMALILLAALALSPDDDIGALPPGAKIQLSSGAPYGPPMQPPFRPPVVTPAASPPPCQGAHLP